MEHKRRQRTVIFTLAAAILSLLTALLFLSYTRYAKAENSYISPDINYSVSESSDTESEQNINDNTEYASEANNAEQQNATNNFKVSKILDSGKPDSESLVLTVMGDGFTDDEKSDFIDKITDAIDELFGISYPIEDGCYPFNLFKGYFTVYAVEVISKESGVNRDPILGGINIVDNYFGSSFYEGLNDGGRERALVIKNKDKAAALTQPYSIATVVLCNSNSEGGTAVGQLITISLEDIVDTLAHELGHSLAGLEDEYYYTNEKFRLKEAPNKTTDNDPETIKWSKWLGYKGIGIYSYGEYAEIVDDEAPDSESYKWYKPSLKCKMDKSVYDFCPVCANELIRAMENKLGKRVFDLSVIADGTEVFINKLNITARDKFIIPDRIDGLPVTEIRSFAFEDQTLCKEFILPEGLRAIGKFAFRGCTALSGQIKIPASLTFYGDGAFYGCNNVTFSVAEDNAVFMSSAGKICSKDRSEILQACSINTTYHIPHFVKKIAPYAFAGNGNLQKLVFNNPITTISEYAFSDCANLTEIIFTDTVTSIDDYAFYGCYSLSTVNFDGTVDRIGKYSFGGNGVLTNVIFNDTVGNIDGSAFLDCTNLMNLKFGKHVDRIGNNAFAKCRRLMSVDLKNGVSEIGNNAFADCDDLSAVYFDSSAPSTVGSDVFLNNDVTIYVPYNAQPAYKTAFPQYANRIDSVRFPVYFMDGEHVIETRDVYYGSTVSLPDYSPVGYDLIGWYDNPEFNGEPYVNGGLWNSEETVTLYAKKTPHDCTVIFDPNGGTLSGGNRLTVKYGQAFSTDITATQNDYVLDGWYYGEIEYVAADGRSIRAWDRTGTTTLTAKWSIRKYEIRINGNGTVTWLSNAEFSGTPGYLQYGSVLSAINLITTFRQSNQGYKEGKIFDHFNYGDSALDWTNIELDEDNPIITITPVWISEKYNIYFNTLCEVTVTSIEATYGSDITLPAPNRKGYTFGGWYDKETGGTKIEWVLMPDLTPDEQSNGSTTLYADWNPITYNIRYLANNGTNQESTVNGIEYDETIVIKGAIFSYTGRTLQGWSDKPDGTVKYTSGKQEQNLTSVQSETIKLYAVWKPITYTVCFHSNTQPDTTKKTTHTYGYEFNLHPNLFTNKGHELKGWATSPSGSVKYTDGQRVNNLASTQGVTVNLYAVWQAKTYKIDFRNLMTNMFAVPDQFTYGVGMSDMPIIWVEQKYGGPYMLDDDFLGWYADASFTTSVTSISDKQDGNIVLFAKYQFKTMGMNDPNTYKVTDSGSQPSFDITFMLNSTYYDMLKSSGLKSIKISISWDMWRVDDGYQYVYVKDGGTTLKKYSYDMAKNTTYHKSYDLYASIEYFKEKDEFRLTFGADGAFSDDWKFKNLCIDVWFTFDEPTIPAKK